MIEGCSHSPDVLDLVIALHIEDGLVTTKQLEIPFGVDTTEFVSAQGVIIGRKVDAGEYYVNRGVTLGEQVVISLLPAIRCLPALDMPTFSDFEAALRTTLSHSTCGWILICERDCDQEPLPQLQYGSPEADLALKKLFAFCGNRQSSCPTFMMQSMRQQPG
jgi:hypothetical protein